MFGSLENYDIHMQGLSRVIGLRGGLTALGLNGLLHRIVVWIDRNAAFLHGSAMYFPMPISLKLVMDSLGGLFVEPNYKDCISI